MPADTSGYMIAGYVVFFTVLSIYVLSLFIRWRNLKQEYLLLSDLENSKE